jgi:ABC-type transport system involved in multi-copper enzyme maturation permease subunit
VAAHVGHCDKEKELLSLYIATLMKFCIIVLVVSLLLLGCSSTSSGNENNENDKKLLKEKRVRSDKEGEEEEIVASNYGIKESASNHIDNTKNNIDITDVINKKNEKNEKNEKNKKNEKNDKKLNIPIWVKGFTEGIFVMIGIAVSYRCFTVNEGHVTEAEWQEMNENGSEKK